MILLEYLAEFCTEDYRKELGKRLKYARKQYNQYKIAEAKLTQKKMADLLHIERQRIINIENGRVPLNFMELIFYSKMCGFSINEFLFDELDIYEKNYFEEELKGNLKDKGNL